MSQTERCPKCSGKMVPYNPGDELSDSHCRICGEYRAGTVVVAMPVIPPHRVYSDHPAAVADRQRRERIRQASGQPPREARKPVGQPIKRPRRLLTPAEKEQIRAGLAAGKSSWEIAAELDRHYTTIWNWIDRNITSITKLNAAEAQQVIDAWATGELKREGKRHV